VDRRRSHRQIGQRERLQSKLACECVDALLTDCDADDDADGTASQSTEGGNKHAQEDQGKSGRGRRALQQTNVFKFFRPCPVPLCVSPDISMTWPRCANC
jgi:hypothetical protein